MNFCDARFYESKHNTTLCDDALSRHSHFICVAFAGTCGKGDPAPALSSCSLISVAVSWKNRNSSVVGAANAVSDVCGLQNMWVPQALFGYRKRVYQVNPGRAFVRVSSVSGHFIGEGLRGFGRPNCCSGPFLAIVACSDFLLSAVARSHNAIRSVRNLCYECCC
jgi:hypothetical protein